jgi:hypothetical protein
MTEPLWKRTDVTANEYRLMWFLIDVGGMGRVVSSGWISKASGEMKLHRSTIYRLVKRLVKKGLLRHVGGKGGVEFNLSGFDSTLPDDFVKLKESDHVKPETGNVTA